jgi:hypothetical protein
MMALKMGVVSTSETSVNLPDCMAHHPIRLHTQQRENVKSNNLRTCFQTKGKPASITVNKPS